MTHEEHIARAMLLGMRYHEGNGIPFYYKVGTDNIPLFESFIDANTMELILASVGYLDWDTKGNVTKVWDWTDDDN